MVEQEQPKRKKASKPVVKETFKWNPPLEDDEASPVAVRDEDPNTQIPETFHKRDARKGLTSDAKKQPAKPDDKKGGADGGDNENSLNERLEILTSRNEKIKEFVSKENGDGKTSVAGDAKDEKDEGKPDQATAPEIEVHAENGSPKPKESPSSPSTSDSSGADSSSGSSDSEQEEKGSEAEGAQVAGQNGRSTKADRSSAEADQGNEKRNVGALTRGTEQDKSKAAVTEEPQQQEKPQTKSYTAPGETKELAKPKSKVSAVAPRAQTTKKAASSVSAVAQTKKRAVPAQYSEKKKRRSRSRSSSRDSGSDYSRSGRSSSRSDSSRSRSRSRSESDSRGHHRRHRSRSRRRSHRSPKRRWVVM